MLFEIILAANYLDIKSLLFVLPPDVYPYSFSLTNLSTTAMLAARLLQT
jgi:hypothetical protein